MDHAGETIDLTSMSDSPQHPRPEPIDLDDIVDLRDRLTPEVLDRLLHLVDRLPHLIGLTDGRGNVEWVNAAGRAYLGVGPDVPIRLDDLFTADSIERYYTDIRPTLLRGEAWTGDIEVRHGGSTSIIEAVVVGEPDRESSAPWLSLMGVDVSEQRRREADLSHRASHDPLTGLPNRALLEERLGVARSVARRTGAQVAIIALDLDGFKQINDSLGHAAGDLLLQQVTARLSATVRPADTVARYGGDEFMIVLHPPESTAAAMHVAQRMRDRLRAPAFRLLDATVQISASVGLTVVEHDDDADVAELVATADRAMYRAKRAGGDCVRLAGTGNVPMAGLDHLDDARIELAHALVEGQIVPAFEPIVDANTGEIRAVEIVPAWAHPTRGLLASADFLDDAEITGQADDIRWAVARAGMAIAHDRRVGVPVEIGVSIGQLRDPDLGNRLGELGPPPPGVDVCTAITGHDVAELGRAAVATADRLTEAGFGIVLARHGTGGLTVALQAQLDLRMVKVDPTITAAAREQPAAVALASTLGRVSGIPTTAVDVADDAMRDVLAVLGIDLVEGPVTGGALTADQLGELTRPRP